jgi:hypothetical protein
MKNWLKRRRRYETWHYLHFDASTFENAINVGNSLKTSWFWFQSMSGELEDSQGGKGGGNRYRCSSIISYRTAQRWNSCRSILRLERPVRVYTWWEKEYRTVVRCCGAGGRMKRIPIRIPSSYAPLLQMESRIQWKSYAGWIAVVKWKIARSLVRCRTTASVSFPPRFSALVWYAASINSRYCSILQTAVSPDISL